MHTKTFRFCALLVVWEDIRCLKVGERGIKGSWKQNLYVCLAAKRELVPLKLKAVSFGTHQQAGIFQKLSRPFQKSRSPAAVKRPAVTWPCTWMPFRFTPVGTRTVSLLFLAKMH